VGEERKSGGRRRGGPRPSTKKIEGRLLISAIPVANVPETFGIDPVRGHAPSPSATASETPSVSQAIDAQSGNSASFSIVCLAEVLTTERLREVHREVTRLQQAGESSALVALLHTIPLEDLVGDPELTYAFAMACAFTGDYRLGEDALQTADARHSWKGNDRFFRLRLNAKGLLARDLGRIEEAGELFTSLAAASFEADDQLRLAFACNNLGAVQWSLGDFSAAANSYRRSRVACMRLGYTRGIGIAGANLAMAHRELGQYKLALNEVRRAISYHREAGAQDMLPTAELELGLLLHLTEDSRLAELMSERAREGFHRLGRRSSVAEADRVLGIIACDTARHDEARARFSNALRTARRLENRMLKAEILEELAVLAAFENHRRRSDKRADEARAAYREIGMAVQADRSARRMAALWRHLPFPPPRSKWWISHANAEE